MKEQIIFQPYHSKRAFQEIALEIKTAILNGKFKAGDRLPPERSLAKQFRVGRLTIREALRTLETTGLISIRHGRSGGSYVGVSDPLTLPSTIMDSLQFEGLTSRQITEARVILECAIVEYAINRASEQNLLVIEKHLQKSKKILGPENGLEVVNRMIDFHVLLAEASHNILFLFFTRTLMEWARRKIVKWAPSAEEQAYSYQSHKKIFSAIQKKEIHKAQVLMKDHIEKIEDFAVATVQAMNNNEIEQNRTVLNP